MPWQLPQEDIEKTWGLINRKTLRWELRRMGGSKLAIDEVRHYLTALQGALRTSTRRTRLKCA